MSKYSINFLLIFCSGGRIRTADLKIGFCHGHWTTLLLFLTQKLWFIIGFLRRWVLRATTAPPRNIFYNSNILFVYLFLQLSNNFFILLFWLDSNQCESNFFNSESTCRKNSGGFRDTSLTTSRFSHLRTKHFFVSTVQRYLKFLNRPNFNS